MSKIPSVRRRPAEYAGALVFAVFGILTALGVGFPALLPAAVVSLVVVVVTGAVELFGDSDGER